ncbi:MAG: hypothetical protein KC464_17785, partial [Myxococcales bacterium]|nr:hypothetical protein [Myxococcales bacterium]
KPGTATAAAIIGTLVGPALIMTGAALSGRDSGDDALESGLYWAGAMGLMLGPSAGHWYAGRTVTAGMGLRAAGATLAVAGAVGSFDKCFFVEEPCDDSGYLAMALLGAGAFVAGVAYDVATADDAAREWNRDHGFSVQVAPTAVRTGAGGVTPGVALAGTF